MDTEVKNTEPFYTETFNFVSALRCLCEGYAVVPVDWTTYDTKAFFMLDTEARAVFNERGFNIDIMQFCNINRWMIYSFPKI